MNNYALPDNIRKLLSQLHSILQKKHFIRATPTFLRNTCGKPNCKCSKGEKHISLYIQQNYKGISRKILVPKSRWQDVQDMIQNYKNIIALLDSISDYQWDHIKDK